MRMLFIFLIIFSATVLNAQSVEDALQPSFEEIGSSVRLLGLGNADALTSGEFSALYWNPASLALLNRSEIVSGVHFLSFDNDATFYENSTNVSKNFLNLRSLGISLKLPTTRGSAAIALGYQQIKDFNYLLQFTGFNPSSNNLNFELDDDQGNTGTYFFDRNVQQEEEVRTRGGLGVYSIGGGIALSPRMYGGITIDYWHGKRKYTQNFYQNDIQDLYNTFPADFAEYRNFRSLEQTYKGLGLRAGITLELSSSFRTGLMITAPMTMQVDEIYSESDEVVFDDGFSDPFDYGTNAYEYEIHIPASVDFGASFSRKNFLIAASFRYRDWSSLEFRQPANPGDRTYFEQLNAQIQQDMQATLEQRIGMEWTLPISGVQLRAGFIHLPSPFRESDSFDRKMITIGGGYQVDPFVSLHIAGIWNAYDQTSEDRFTPGGTDEKIRSFRLLLGIRYQFE